jgi:hypothetical protein
MAALPKRGHFGSSSIIVNGKAGLKFIEVLRDFQWMLALLGVQGTSALVTWLLTTDDSDDHRLLCFSRTRLCAHRCDRWFVNALLRRWLPLGRHPVGQGGRQWGVGSEKSGTQVPKLFLECFLGTGYNENPAEPETAYSRLWTLIFKI